MKILRVPLMAVVYFCIATVLAQTGAMLMLAAQGRLTADRLLQLLAVVYDVDLYSMRKKVENRVRPIAEAQLSFDEVIKKRRELDLDLDLREINSEKGLQDIRQLESFLVQEQAQYLQVKTKFDDRFDQLKEGAADQSLQEVARQLDIARPELAKDQIIRILKNPAIEPDVAMQYTVTILKSIPLDKRKKILTQFMATDMEQLHEILRQIRLGSPDVDLIRQTRKRLEQFDVQS